MNPPLRYPVKPCNAASSPSAMPCPLTIDSVRLRQVDLPPRAVCTGAIRPFVTPETLLLTVRRSDGREGTGYAYPAQAPGLGIEWDWDAIATRQNADRTLYRATT